MARVYQSGHGVEDTEGLSGWSIVGFRSFQVSHPGFVILQDVGLEGFLDLQQFEVTVGFEHPFLHGIDFMTEVIDAADASDEQPTDGGQGCGCYEHGYAGQDSEDCTVGEVLGCGHRPIHGRNVAVLCWC